MSNPPFTEFSKVNRDTNINELNLDWNERDLPEKIRTKHVHRLHPYLGKFIPQLAEIFLRKYRPKHVIDPFCGSGTTLVEANILGIQSTGCDISEFNCVLSKVKTHDYDIKLVEEEINDIGSRMKEHYKKDSEFSFISDINNEYLNSWFAETSLKTLLCFQEMISEYKYQDLLNIILSRSARSARLTTHYDLDFPKKPQTEPYSCFKHSRTCTPTKTSYKFIDRYVKDSLKRIKEFSNLRTDSTVDIIHNNSSTADFPIADMVFTSPPYVGLIDYHEQHRYAYELLSLDSREEQEIGPASKGQSKIAKEQYIANIKEVFLNISKTLEKDSIIGIVVNDRHGLYENMCNEIGFNKNVILERKVNRRTGLRSTKFNEKILVYNSQ